MHIYFLSKTNIINEINQKIFKSFKNFKSQKIDSKIDQNLKIWFEDCAEQS